MTVRDLVESFLKHCARNEREPETLKSYRNRLKWLVTTFGDRDLASLGREEVLDGIVAAGKHADGRQMSTSTRRSNIVIFELLQTYAISFEHLAKPWTQKKDLVKPKQGERKRVLTDDEIARILGAGHADFVQIYGALLLCGARPSELCNADITDLEGTDETLVLVLDKHKTANKTGEARRIPIGDQLLPIIVAARGSRTEGPIFLTGRGKKWNRDQVSRRFRQIRDELKLDKDIVLYTTRHTVGTRIALKDGIWAAGQVLGHKSTETTKRYAHAQDKDIRKIQSGAMQLPPPKKAA
jgi:integrase